MVSLQAARSLIKHSTAGLSPKIVVETSMPGAVPLEDAGCQVSHIDNGRAYLQISKVRDAREQ